MPLKKYAEVQSTPAATETRPVFGLRGSAALASAAGFCSWPDALDSASAISASTTPAHSAPLPQM
jgi:hypothetical protein